MTSTFVRSGMAFLLITVLSGPTYAQEKPKGVFAYLQKEPVTLYDVGMKSLRRLALDAAVRITATPDMEAASSVGFKPTVGNIEIVFNVKTEDADDIDGLRQQCIKLRKNTILKMFRIGLTDFSTPLSISERIRRRIGGQFAHEPMGSMEETQSLGDRLGLITYFSIKLTTTAEPAVSVTCRALTTDFMLK